MNETNNYENFVFYGSWRTLLEGFPEDIAKEILWQTMLLGTTGELTTDNPMIQGIVIGAIAPNIKKAKDRYAVAVENGKKGGRKERFSADEIQSLKQQGLTNQQIADKLGCSVSTVEKKAKQPINEAAQPQDEAYNKYGF